jgi:hypothetical protein
MRCRSGWFDSALGTTLINQLRLALIVALICGRTSGASARLPECMLGDLVMAGFAFGGIPTTAAETGRNAVAEQGGPQSKPGGGTGKAAADRRPSSSYQPPLKVALQKRVKF